MPLLLPKYLATECDPAIEIGLSAKRQYRFQSRECTKNRCEARVGQRLRSLECNGGSDMGLFELLRGRVRVSTARNLEPLLTVAVVVRNDPTGLAQTLNSLAASWQPSTECLVVDGSDDRRLVEAVVGEYESIWVRLCWSEPRGVYPAMNEALAQARGQYVWFVNAGDRVNSDASINTVLQILEKRPLWAYGQVRFIDDRGRTVLPPPFDYGREKRSNFNRGRFPPHQGTVVATQAIRELGGFDEDLRVAADYAMMLRLSRLDDPVESREVWADFYEGGLSTKQWRRAIREFHFARMEVLRPSGIGLVNEFIVVARQFLRHALARSLNSMRH